MHAPELPTLKTKRLVLRPFDLADAPVVQMLAGEPAVAATTLHIPHPYEDGVAEDWIRTHEPLWMDGRRLVLAVTNKSDDVVGAISLRIDGASDRGELGYWIGVPFWNRGYATEAARAVLAFGFSELGLNRIEAHYIAGNIASRRVMMKLGMKEEACLRRHTVKSGVTHDLVIFAKLASEVDSESFPGGIPKSL